MPVRDASSINLNLLPTLLALLEEQNVTHAAARLRVTQPAVSRALERLRQELAIRCSSDGGGE